ncbi:MAG: hypothetical protein QF473_00330 [Planctomycetota bacterium]|jgi:hypothetical protein|nr:hypothetical protein [Planctomycetota bacterium]
MTAPLLAPASTSTPAQPASSIQHHLLKLCAFLLLPAASAAPLSRTVLALYDGNEHEAPVDTPIYTSLEVVCDHLGLLVHYHDVRKGLPGHEAMKSYRGILTWFSDQKIEDPEDYIEWLKKESKLGRYVVVIGLLGARKDDEGNLAPIELVQSLYEFWGVKFPGIWLNNPLLVQVNKLDKAVMDFERPLVTETIAEASLYEQFTPIDKTRIETFLELKCLALQQPPSSVVAVHPYGGYCMSGYMTYSDPETFKRQWYLNPFEFLRRALRWQGAPCPDVTTLNGSRIFYSHVDGDASISLSRIDKKRLTAEVLYEEVLRESKLPITISAIEAELTTAESKDWIESNQRIQDVYRKIFALDRVEPASHAYTHPYHWAKALTAMGIEGYSTKPANDAERALIGDTPYESSSILRQPGWEEREIAGSIDFINKNLVPEGKACRLFQWSGNCRPTPAAMAVIASHNLLNINGGDPRFDDFWPSYTGLRPAVRQVGKHIQVHASASNENLYTDLWKRNYGGFKNVMLTFERTGSPRRIKPINVYYHFYSAEKIAALKALREIYSFCSELDIAPLFASEYVEMVLDSRKVVFSREEAEKNEWKWSGTGKCRTLRWDGVDAFPDLEKSRGIIGFYKDKKLNALYVHLDGSGEGRLVWSKEQPKRPYLSSASGHVNQWKMSDGAVGFDFHAKGDAWFEIGGLEAGKEYSCELGDKARKIKANEKGVVSVEVKEGMFIKNLEIGISKD